MQFCKSGEIGNYCHPNALMTLSEYLVDYASPATAEKGWQIVDEELGMIPDEKRRAQCARNIEAIRNGEGRDYRF